MDKQLLKQRFYNAKDTYQQHALVQADMADALLKLAIPHLKNKTITKMLELGSGTGLLTKEILKCFKPLNYCANDLEPSTKNVIKTIVEKQAAVNFNFLAGDIEQLQFTNQQNIIWSGATIQWIQNLEAFFNKMHHILVNDGYLILSSFSTCNYKEIKSITGCGIDYIDVFDMMKKAAVHFEVLDFKEWQQQLWFETPIDVLKHMRYTGVNATSKCRWTKKDLFNFNTEYEKYKQEKGYPLTYHPYLLVLKKISK